MMKRLLIIISFIFSTFFSIGQNQNISQGFVFDGEPFIAINPSNSQHMVVAWMSWTINDKIVIKTRSSFNAGQTWSTAIKIPHVAADLTSADVAIEFDDNNNVFLSFIDFSGFDSDPFFGAVYVIKSTDGGLSWGSAVEVINIDSDPGKRAIDRPWISIDRSGGPNNGNIYVTSMNAKEAEPTGGFNPYLTVSTDGGNSFEQWRYLDSTNWWSGLFFKQPMPTNTVSSTGVFHAVYPSFVFNQNVLPQFIIATSEDGGNSFEYHSVLVTNAGVTDPLAKKGYLILADPTDANHLVFVYLNIPVDDIDVYMKESFDGGVSWSDGIRINDDPIGNNRMQDLLWGDFDSDGDLVISWRDRRNADDSTYTTSSEIWGAVRKNDAADFSPNFQITDQNVAYDPILSFSGNDFMCIKLDNDTLNAVWGDTRNGKLNIWYQKMDINGVIQSIQKLASENLPTVFVYPNPVKNELNIKGDHINQLSLKDSNGKILMENNHLPGIDSYKINMSFFPSGIYFLNILSDEGFVTLKVIKK
jgi:hypothetical protein